MRTKKLLALAAVATIALSSCNNNDDMAPVNVLPEDGVIRVATNVATPQTRAGITSDNMRLFNLKIENTANVAYSYYATMLGGNANDWESFVADTSAPLLMLWQNNTQPVEVTALCAGGYVTEEAFNQTTRYGVIQDQSNDGNILNSDYIYMPTTTVHPDKPLAEGGLTTDGKLPITLKHIFSKVNLTLTLGTEFNAAQGGTAANPISSLTVNGTKQYVNFNASTGVMTDYDGPIKNPVISITPWAGLYRAGSGTTACAVAKYEVILMPQTVASGTFSVSFTIGGKKYEWKSSAAVTFESDKQYTLALTVGKDIVTPDTFTSSEWTEGTGGSLETE